MSSLFSISPAVDYLHSPPNPSPTRNDAEVERLFKELKLKFRHFWGLRSSKATAQFIESQLTKLGSMDPDTNYWVTAAVLDNAESLTALTKSMDKAKDGIKYLIDRHAFITQECVSLAYDVHIVYVGTSSYGGPPTNPTNTLDWYHGYMRRSKQELRTLLIIELQGDRRWPNWPAWVSIIRARKAKVGDGVTFRESPRRLKVEANSTQMLKFVLEDLATPDHLRYYHSGLDLKRPIRLSLGIIFNRIQSIKEEMNKFQLVRLWYLQTFDRSVAAAHVGETENDTLNNNSGLQVAVDEDESKTTL